MQPVGRVPFVQSDNIIIVFFYLTVANQSQSLKPRSVVGSEKTLSTVIAWGKAVFYRRVVSVWREGSRSLYGGVFLYQTARSDVGLHCHTRTLPSSAFLLFCSSSGLLTNVNMFEEATSALGNISILKMSKACSY